MSAEPLIVSVSGLRGVVGATLTHDVAARYAAAFAADLPPGPIVIGRDGRASGGGLAAAITERLTIGGRDVIDCGVAATPSIGVAVRHLRAAGGIQVSASHNPARYNGLKLFAAAGRVLPAAAGRTVLERFHAAPEPLVADRRGSVVAHDAVPEHLRLVLATVDVAAIRRRRPKVWIDCGHGAGSRGGIPLLEALGCEVVATGEVPDGGFEHEPEPTAANLAPLLPRIPNAGADVGFFQDPDADRLAIASATGRFIGEEATLALAVEGVLAHRRGPVVVNCSTSRMTARIASRHGVACHVSAVGEANVVDRMLEVDAVLGGEGNGGVIDPRVVLVRDSLVAMALVLERLATAVHGTTIDTLAADLPRGSMKKTTITLPGAGAAADLAAVCGRIAAAFPAAESSRLDGLRLDWEGGWLLVRASNTEPIVRLVCEADSDEAVDAALTRAVRAIG